MTSTLIILTSFVHFLFVVTFNNFEFLSILYLNQPKLMLLSILLFSLGIIIETLGFRFRAISFGMIGAGLVLFNYLFYIANTSSIVYINPFSLIILTFGSPYWIFVSTFFYRQFNLVSRSLTYKQSESMIKEAEKLRFVDSEAFSKLMFQIRGIINFRSRISSTINFLTRSRQKSLFD